MGSINQLIDFSHFLTTHHPQSGAEGSVQFYGTAESSQIEKV